ncbi:hypothetical protein OA514_01265 [Prochlorococcus sp. AH-716-G04]|nr:hypothetical protein [Prochlorococcus sp. AH-716-G04]
MLIPIKKNQISKLIPSVGTGGQFKYALGDPRKILQRLIISSIGGVLNLLLFISQSSTQTENLWLLLCVIFFLYIIWGPIVESSRKNIKYKKSEFFSLFDGYVSDIYKTERIESSREQSNRQGRLELIEKKRTWLVIELDDEDGYLDKISFPMENKHSLIRVGSNIRCIISSNYRNFEREISLTDAWLPDSNIWIGEYPYLLRPAFEEICYIYLK